MNLYDVNGNVLPVNETGNHEEIYLSSSTLNRLKANVGLDVAGFDIVKEFAPFDVDYATETGTPSTLNIPQDDFYSLFYDDYVGAHGDLMVTKKNLGKEQSGEYDIWCYDFIPYKAKAKVLLSSALHPFELPASFGLALWIKNYMTSTDAVFEYLRENVQLSVIPIANPYGFNQNPKILRNVNGVNINRNYDTWDGDWEEYSDAEQKGLYPFSEAESKILAKWVKDNTDALFYIDCHTGVGLSVADNGDVWFQTLSSNRNLSRLRSAAEQLSAYLQNKYHATPKTNIVVDSESSIRAKFITTVVDIPTMTIEQAQSSDTIYQTVPNNCKTAISEYATNIHAYIMAQLQNG